MEGGGNGNAECRKNSIGELFDEIDPLEIGRSLMEESGSTTLNPGLLSISGGVGVLVEGIITGLGID